MSIPLLAGLLFFRNFQKHLTFIFAVVLIGALTEVLNQISVYDNEENMFWMNIYTLLEGIGISLFFITTDKFSKPEKNLIRLFILLLCIAFLAYMTIEERWGKMSPITTTLESVFVILLSLKLFWNILFRQQIENLSRNPIFWINTALILYFSGSIFLFIFSEYLVQNDPNAFLQIWGLHSVFNIAFNVLLTIGFIHSKKATA